MAWLRSVFEDYPRRFMLLVVALVVVVVMFATGPVAPVYADVCGTAPDWWTTAYWTWLSCEVTNNGATYTVSEITSPVLNTIDSDLQTINTALAPLSSMTGSIVGAVNNVTAFLTPSSTDGSALATQIQGIAQQNTALAYAVTLTSAVQSVQTAVDAVSWSSTTVDTSHDSVLTGAPVTYTDVYGNTQSISLGPLGVGISWFLYGIDRLGWHPAQFRQFFDAWWFLVVVVAILRDLGVQVGAVPRAVSEHQEFMTSGKEADKKGKGN